MEPPVLLFHRVFPEVPRRFNRDGRVVEPRRFERWLMALRGRGFRGAAFEEASAGAQGRPVIAAFDAALYEHNAYALPILARHAFPAALFLDPYLLGTPIGDGHEPPGRHATAEEVRELARSGAAFLLRGVEGETVEALRRRKARAEEAAGAPVTVIGWLFPPPPDALAAAAEAGFRRVARPCIPLFAWDSPASIARALNESRRGPEGLRRILWKIGLSGR